MCVQYRNLISEIETGTNLQLTINVNSHNEAVFVKYYYQIGCDFIVS